VTYYRYFSNKDDLVKLIRDRLISEGFSRFDEISRLETSFADKVDLMTEWRRDFFSGMSTDFIEEVLSMKDLNEMIKERFFSMITSAQDKGDIRRELSPELVWLVTEKLYELITDGSWKNITPDYSEYQAQMRTLFFHGLLTNNPE
jgi:AcrR family transcriptional regulator